uniref:Uncharacterized protein n=1 Tax=Arundo donax TaxID=35708 RepID=A0A0A9EXC4_ARUDO
MKVCLFLLHVSSQQLIRLLQKLQCLFRESTLAMATWKISTGGIIPEICDI